MSVESLELAKCVGAIGRISEGEGDGILRKDHGMQSSVVPRSERSRVVLGLEVVFGDQR